MTGRPWYIFLLQLLAGFALCLGLMSRNPYILTGSYLLVGLIFLEAMVFGASMSGRSNPRWVQVAAVFVWPLFVLALILRRRR